MTEIDELFEGVAVMAIFRNTPIADAVQRAHKAWDLGIDLVEIPIQTPDAVPVLEAVVKAGRDRGKRVGAGTVTTEDQVDIAKRIGVAFTVAPGLDGSVLEASRRVGVPHIPGVASASEIQSAVRFGCTWVKAFPATILGPGWFKAMSGPFPEVSFLATGGIDASNAKAFLSAGASVVAVGSALADPSQIDLLADLLGNSGEVA